MSNHSHRSYTDEELVIAVVNSYSNVIIRLGLVPAGGNYEQVNAIQQATR